MSKFEFSLPCSKSNQSDSAPEVVEPDHTTPSSPEAVANSSSNNQPEAPMPNVKYLELKNLNNYRLACINRYVRLSN